MHECMHPSAENIVILNDKVSRIFIFNYHPPAESTH